MASFKSVAIKSASNEGVDFPVYLNGERIGTLKALSAWSDKFQTARTMSLRDGPSGEELKAMTSEQRTEHAKQIRLTLLASMVASWDFDEDCTLENVKEFFANAPHIADNFDNFTSDAGNFYRA